MKRKRVPEYSRVAAARLQGHVEALEFINETKNEQLIREQWLLAKLAVAATECGIQLNDVFADNEDLYHIGECVRIHFGKKANGSQ